MVSKDPEDQLKVSILYTSSNRLITNSNKFIPQKLKYPTSVFFIIVNEFCERFSYYGMKSKLFRKVVYIQLNVKFTIVFNSLPYSCAWTLLPEYIAIR